MQSRRGSAGTGRALICCIGLLLAPVPVALGDTLYVPSQYPTIQAAINACVDDDVVVVADGTYTGTGNRDLDYLGKAITVRSASGPAHCVIDCQHSLHRGFRFHSGEGASSVLEGLTIQNGLAPEEPECYSSGGAILCRDNSNPTIRNCILVNNSASW